MFSYLYWKTGRYSEDIYFFVMYSTFNALTKNFLICVKDKIRLRHAETMSVCRRLRLLLKSYWNWWLV